MSNSSTNTQIIRLNKANIRQAVQGTYTSTQTITMTNANTWYDVPNLSVSITPTSTNSVIILFYNLSHSGSAQFIQVYRNGNTEVGVGTGSTLNITSGLLITVGTNCITSHAMIVDSPGSTSTQTYTLRVANSTAGQTTYINRSDTDVNSSGYCRATSSIIALEVLL